MRSTKLRRNLKRLSQNQSLNLIPKLKKVCCYSLLMLKVYFILHTYYKFNLKYSQVKWILKFKPWVSIVKIGLRSTIHPCSSRDFESTRNQSPRSKKVQLLEAGAGTYLHKFSYINPWTFWQETEIPVTSVTQRSF